MNQAAAPTERAQLPGNLSRLRHASLGKEYEKTGGEDGERSREVGGQRNKKG